MLINYTKIKHWINVVFMVIYLYSLEPEWTAAATQVKEQTSGRVKLGAVDATVHQGLASRYGVSLIPESFSFISD